MNFRPNYGDCWLTSAIERENGQPLRTRHHYPPRKKGTPIRQIASLLSAPHTPRSRRAFLTSAARRGAPVFKMRDVSRHKSMDVLQAYVRDADLFRDHAGTGLL